MRDRSRAERIRFVAWLEPVETGISGFDQSWMSSRMTFSSIPMSYELLAYRIDEFTVDNLGSEVCRANVALRFWSSFGGM